MRKIEDNNVQPFVIDTPGAPDIWSGLDHHPHMQANLEQLRADPAKVDQLMQDMEREISRRQLLAAGQANRPD